MRYMHDRLDGKWPIIIIFVICSIWAIAMGTVGWNNGLSMHGFRQTQTAITSYYFVQGGPFLRYETPIFGVPWSIPFEFPLYQWIVATVSKTLNIQLETSGRLISELFYWLSLTAMWGVLSELRVRRVYRLIFVTLTLVSPQYIYYSRTFMIESTALFFCMAYLYFFVRYIRTRQPMDACIGGVFGLIGALVKLTTFPPFALVGGMLYAWSLWRELGVSKEQRKSLKLYFPHVMAVVVFFCVPVLITGIWVHFTDQTKTLNIVTAGHLTSTALQEWTFGTFQQRFSGSTWKRMLSQTIPELSGSPLVLLLPCLGLYFAPSRLAQFVTSIIAFLSVFLIFTNLHVVHDYYAYANGVFLIAAVSWCIVGLLESERIHQYFGMTVFLICIVSSIWVYYGRLHGFQKSEGRAYANLSLAIKETTKPSDVILIFQNDFSPELAYSSERRALMWPRWMEQRMDALAMTEAMARLGNNKIGAVVFCDDALTDSNLIQRAVVKLKLTQQPQFQDTTCTYYPSSELAGAGQISSVPDSRQDSEPSNKVTHYGGAVDSVTCGAISGWVWDSTDASENIRVTIYVDGNGIGNVPASIPRPDLKMGTGKYGFGIPVPSRLKDGRTHSVSARISDGSYDIKVWEKIQPSFTCKP